MSDFGEPVVTPFSKDPHGIEAASDAVYRAAVELATAKRKNSAVPVAQAIFDQAVAALKVAEQCKKWRAADEIVAQQIMRDAGVPYAKRTT